MKIAYFDCFSGISGDMILGSLLDAGLDFSKLRKELAHLDLREYSLHVKKVKRGSLTGTKLGIVIGKNSKRYDYNEMVKVIQNGKLTQRIKDKSGQILTRLADSEAKIHGVSLQKVNFHELGSVDTIVDIVGGVIAFDILGIEKIYVSALPMGQGMVDVEHGLLPVPAPATLDLLKDIPVRFGSGVGELVTPTGAAIVSTLADKFGNCPEMKVQRIGYGAGDKDFPKMPNLLRVSIGETTGSEEEDIITVIETNTDDMNPQILGYVMEKLFSKGALDVFFTPICAKKNRPGILLTILSETFKADSLVKIILEETTSIGVRIYETRRKKLKREIKEVETKYGKMKIKNAYLNGKLIKSQPEYEDCKKIAEEKNIPLVEILKEVNK